MLHAITCFLRQRHKRPLLLSITTSTSEMLKPRATGSKPGHLEHEPAREGGVPSSAPSVLTVFLENLLKVWLGGCLHRAVPICTSFGAFFWGRGAH